MISPLISLMMDQVKALNEAGIHAAYINSSLTENQVAKALEFAKAGRYKIVYVAPERLETPRFLDFACHAEISMVTIDEAHCISQWGTGFQTELCADCFIYPPASCPSDRDSLYCHGNQSVYRQTSGKY